MNKVHAISERHANARADKQRDRVIGSRVLHAYVITSHIRSEARGECYRGRSIRDGEGDVVLRFMTRAVFAPAPRASWGTLWAYGERLQRLDHPNIERVLECGMAPLGDEERFCVVSDAVDGDTLLEHVRSRGHLDVAEALTIGRQIAQDMGALHRLGMIHGDLRATNIALVRSASNDGADARPVVCELGLTSLALEAEGVAPSLRAMLLSPENIAPEQIRDEPVNAVTDVYAFGTILYRMLTGVAAFQGDNVSQTLRAHLTRSPPSLKERVHDVPDSVDALVARCLASRPGERFPSFDALLAQLHECEAKVLSIASIRSPAWPALRSPSDSDDARADHTAASSAPPAPATSGSTDSEAPAERTSVDLTSDDATEINDAPEATHTPSERPRRSARTTRSFMLTKPAFRITALLTLALGSAGGYVASSQLAAGRATITSPATVRFAVLTNARNATVTLRGRSYPCPIEIELPPGTAIEVIEVRAPEHSPRSVAMFLDHAMRVELNLEPTARSGAHEAH